MVSAHELSLIPLGPFDDPALPQSFHASCARLALQWPEPKPLCCARGAPIDVRAKLELVQALPQLQFDGAGPVLDGDAVSGVIERLADLSFGCAALDPAIEPGIDGSGCTIRAAARATGRREDVWLPTACAIFPLDVRDGTLVPSLRIPRDALIVATGTAPSLFDLAAARVAIRFGEAFAKDAVALAKDLRERKSDRPIHLKMVK